MKDSQIMEKNIFIMKKKQNYHIEEDGILISIEGHK